MAVLLYNYLKLLLITNSFIRVTYSVSLQRITQFLLPQKQFLLNDQNIGKRRASATGWTAGVHNPACSMMGFVFFASAFKPSLGPTHPLIQWIPVALYPGLKRQWREADHSPPSSAKVKNAWRYTSTSQYVFMVWFLVKHRGNFTFTVLICFLLVRAQEKLSRVAAE
jgi:hypothetical protein